MGLTSMTGFADIAGEAGGIAWAWEARSVNARGLDLRIRLPEGFEALEPDLRAAVGAALARGAVTVTLRLGQGAGRAVPRLDPAALELAIAAAEAAGATAGRLGVDLAPMTAADLLGLPGVVELERPAPASDTALLDAVRAAVDPLAARLGAARRAEGAALARLVAAQVARIAELAAVARTTAEARAARSGEALRARVEALLGAGAPIDEARLAQELALLAVKADVTEELDRLDAHVAAARELLEQDRPVGRQLDFLMQEFNREANTLCAKSGSSELTALGLELKVAIDRMREQVQNVE